jgi:hypothetical protein
MMNAIRDEAVMFMSGPREMAPPGRPALQPSL